MANPADGLLAGQDAWVTGWGTLTQGGSTSETLQKVSVPILSNEQCVDSNYAESQITDRMMCAGGAGGKDSCQGDSGGKFILFFEVSFSDIVTLMGLTGPLQVQDGQGVWKLAGVVSWGYGCALPNWPGVYARITSVYPWICSVINDNDPTICTVTK